MAREIPGFYYDEAKGKYFRIQPSHRVTPGTGYTTQKVRAAEHKKAEEKRASHRHRRKTAETVKRAKALHVTPSPLFARLGASPAQNRASAIDEYARSLSQYPICDAIPAYPDGRGFTGATFHITHSGTLRTGFTPNRPMRSNNLLSAKSTYRTSTYREDALPFLVPPDSSFDFRYTGIDIEPKFVTSLYSGGEECAVVTANQGASYHVRPVQSDGNPHSYASVLMNMSQSSVEAIWDIAAAPSAPELVLATDAGLFHGYCPNNDVARVRTQRLTRSEIMNVVFKDDKIVMSGERSGRINLTDLRFREGNSVVRLLHSSAVLATVPIHFGHHVLVHGFSSTNTYDLRYVKQAPIKATARSSQKSRQSTPLLEFAVPKGRHSDRYSLGKKLAYSSDLDLVAAVSVNDFSADVVVPGSPAASFVTLYSTRTGRMVDSPLTRHRYGREVRSVDIRRVRDGPESIFVLSGSMIDEWRVGGGGWGSTDCDDDHNEKSKKSSSPSVSISQMHQGNDSRRHIVRDLSIEQEWDRGNQPLNRLTAHSTPR